MACFGGSPYLFGMLLAAILLSVTAPVAADAPAHVYTTEELDRRYGRPPAVSAPIDRSRPEDWAWVQEFIDREHARIDADRDFDLKRRAGEVAAAKPEPSRCSGILVWGGYGYGRYGRWSTPPIHFRGRPRR